MRPWWSLVLTCFLRIAPLIMTSALTRKDRCKLSAYLTQVPMGIPFFFKGNDRLVLPQCLRSLIKVKDQPRDLFLLFLDCPAGIIINSLISGGIITAMNYTPGVVITWIDANHCGPSTLHPTPRLN